MKNRTQIPREQFTVRITAPPLEEEHKNEQEKNESQFTNENEINEK
jgi:hypothetical protein